MNAANTPTNRVGTKGLSRIHLGNIAHVRHNPFDRDHALEIFEDGALHVNDAGEVADLGPRARVVAAAPHVAVVDHGAAWILPGMVDGHIHFPQYHAIAADGGQLLEWLKNEIFPGELRFEDRVFARRTAEKFIARLLASGTTTAMVFGSQFPHATEALFDAAREAGSRMIAGMTLMDQNGPPELFTAADRVPDSTEAMLEHIADDPLLDYALTPRFALSCTQELLSVCGALMEKHPGLYLQTHINENREEIKAVRAAYPCAPHYLGVYENAGLLSAKTVLAHNIHASTEELEMMAAHAVSVCHCPSSNLFLGSGLFPLARHLEHRVPVLVGTDVGAGAGFCMVEELGHVYRVQQINGFPLHAGHLLYLGTLAGARALDMDQRIGNFLIGKQADAVVLKPDPDGYLTERLEHASSPEARLFALLLLAGPRQVALTLVAGRTAYQASPATSQN